jgi:NAD-dependent deacetylase
MNVLKIVFLIALGYLPALGGVFTDTGTWYASLQKPVFNPPGWVFAPVWSLLYLTIGLSFYFLYHGMSRFGWKIWGLVAVHHFLNFIWTPALFSNLPPLCEKCGKVLKPDFVFFGEPIPERARTGSFHEAEVADVFLLIGTTGEIMPASMIPHIAKSNGALIIEVNPKKSNYTTSITDIFVPERATEAMTRLGEELQLHH